jgi:GntR family transcriptional regulator
MSFRIDIGTGNPNPIYKQIMEQVRQAVVSLDLSPGDRMPSVRQLAEQLVINPNTVSRAYAELNREGLLVSKQGRGIFVAERRMPFSVEERLRRLESATSTFVNEVLMLDFEVPELLAAVEKQLTRLGLSREERP